MSETPIFDATLADAPVNIWEASSIFPKRFALAEYVAKGLGVPLLQPAFTDWTAINRGATP